MYNKKWNVSIFSSNKIVLMIGCHDTLHINAVGYCENVKDNNLCNNEETAIDAWRECPKTCGCGKLNQ